MHAKITKYLSLFYLYIVLLSNRSGSSDSYCHIFYLIAFLKEAFIRNVI